MLKKTCGDITWLSFVNFPAKMINLEEFSPLTFVFYDLNFVFHL